MKKTYKIVFDLRVFCEVEAENEMLALESAEMIPFGEWELDKFSKHSVSIIEDAPPKK